LAPPDQQGFGALVRAALSDIIGDSGASAILFYLGELDPKTFEAKLAAIMGEGAARLVIQDLRRRDEEAPAPHKRRWFGGRSVDIWPAQFGWLFGLGFQSLLS
jgi:hypothetical protein